MENKAGFEIWLLRMLDGQLNGEKIQLFGICMIDRN